MPEDNEITPYSLCDDCPCECPTANYKLIVITCEKRAKHEAPEQQAEE